jgi:hypothetical protein
MNEKQLFIDFMKENYECYKHNRISDSYEWKIECGGTCYTLYCYLCPENNGALSVEYEDDCTHLSVYFKKFNKDLIYKEMLKESEEYCGHEYLENEEQFVDFLISINVKFNQFKLERELPINNNKEEKRAKL